MTAMCNKCRVKNDLTNLKYGETARCSNCDTVVFSWIVFKKRRK